MIGLISTGEAVAQRLVRHMKASNERAQRQGERASRRRRTGSVNYKELDGGDDSEGEGKENGGGGGKGGLLKPDPMEVDGGGGKGKGKAKAPAVGAKRKKAEDGNEEYEGEDDEEEGEEEEEEEEDFVGIESTLIELITKFVPDEGQGSLRKRDGQGRVLGEKEPFFYAQKKVELIAAVQDLELPQFPLDDLLEQLGGWLVVLI